MLVSLQVHVDLRDRLGKVKSFDDVQAVASDMNQRLKADAAAIHDGQTDAAATSVAVPPEQGASCYTGFVYPTLPLWLAQPKLRNLNADEYDPWHLPLASPREMGDHRACCCSPGSPRPPSPRRLPAVFPLSSRNIGQRAMLTTESASRRAVPPK